MKITSGLTASFIAAALIGGCAQKETKEDDLASGILLKNIDSTVRPGDNFERYVNGSWLKSTTIPSDKSSYGAFDFVNDKAQEDVKKIIENAGKSDAKDGSNEQKIGDLYASYMNQAARDANGLKPLEADLAKINAISNYDELATFLGSAAVYGNMSPFSFSVAEDFKNPKEYMLMSWQGGLGLPEREYYLLNDAKSKKLRNEYQGHIEKMMDLANVPHGAKKAAAILKLETQIAAIHMKKEDTRNTAALYNKYATKDLNTLMPDFNWKNYMAAAKIPSIDTVVISQLDYTKKLDALIKKTPLDTWKNYLTWGAVHGAATILTKPLDEENFAFYGKKLYGQEEQKPQWRRGVNMVNGNLGEAVGELYVAAHFPPEAKVRMHKMVINLLKAYEQSIRKLDWMSEATKKEALAKIAQFNPKIGYPDKWRDYTKLKITKDDLYGNMERSAEFEYNRQMDKLGKPVDKYEWGMSPQTVNAYYNPSGNEIVFPAAILQPPFFDLNADDAVNYGGIGGVIGHEIGHGFDDQGATFDGTGAMRNWWTEQDLASFKERTKALSAQYSGFKVFPDLSVNGEYTLGENIGDLGGLTIAMKAYQLSLDGKKAPTIDGFTGDQRVLLGWAQVWLNKDREEALRSQVASDPHSPSKFRINGVVRNVPEFYSAFDVKPTDSLYLAPEKRVKIW